jgi:hypothetical protein
MEHGWAFRPNGGYGYVVDGGVAFCLHLFGSWGVFSASK